MLVGFACYSRDRNSVVLRENSRSVLAMATRSIVGSFVCGRLLGPISSTILLPLLAVILLLLTGKALRHK